jgi:hypothetical protein
MSCRLHQALQFRHSRAFVRNDNSPLGEKSHVATGMYPAPISGEIASWLQDFSEFFTRPFRTVSHPLKQAGSGTLPTRRQKKMRSLLLLTAIISAQALWADSQQCILEAATLNGAYNVTITGTAGSPVWAPFTGPVATLSKFVFDGSGHLQVPLTTIVAANPPLNVTPPIVIQGTYTLSRDCVGTLTLNFSPAPNAHYNVIVSPDGRQISMIATDKGDVLTATGTRLDRN